MSHILIKIVPGYETTSGIKNKIDNFKNQVKETGFEESAKLTDLEIKEIVLYKDDGDVVPEIGKVIGINNFFFGMKRKQNEVAGPFVGYDGNFYLFFIENYIEPRIKSLDEIKEKLKEKAKREKALELAKEQAQKCFEEIKNGKSLAQAASNFSKKPRTTNFFSMKDFIPGVPYSSEFYGLAFTQKEGDIGLASTEKGAFIIKLLRRRDVNKEDFQKVSGPIIVNLFTKKKNTFLTYWLQKLREAAKIKDDRYLIDIY